jgi:hypothetical protein
LYVVTSKGGCPDQQERGARGPRPHGGGPLLYSLERRRRGAWRRELNELAVATEAVVTDVLLSAREGVLEIESVHDEEVFSISVAHPEIKERRMRDLEGVLRRFLDDYEITPTRATLVKRLR